MVAAFRVGARQLEEFEKLCGVPANSFDELLRALEALSPYPIDPSKIHTVFRDTIGREVGSALFSQILSLAAFTRQRSIKADDTIDAISRGIDQSHPDWIIKNGTRWESCRDYLRRLISAPPIEIVTKTIDISVDYQSIVADVALITDVRPVFDTDYTKIIGTILTTSLFLSYVEGDTSRSLNLMLGLDELNQLKKEVDRALNKIEVVKNSLMPVTGDNFFIPGVSSDE